MGYELDVDGFSCLDVDECDLGNDDCLEPFVCLNTVGSFECHEVLPAGPDPQPTILEPVDQASETAIATQGIPASTIVVSAAGGIFGAGLLIGLYFYATSSSATVEDSSVARANEADSVDYPNSEIIQMEVSDESDIIIEEL